jgi:flavin-binding protein dodecin
MLALVRWPAVSSLSAHNGEGAYVARHPAHRRDNRLTSQTGPEEAVRQATARATAAMPDVENVEVKRVEALLENANVVGYRVVLDLTRSVDPQRTSELQEIRGSHDRVPSSENGSKLEAVKRRVLLEDLDQEEIDESQRFLVIKPAEYGSGSSDVSVNHDRYLFED